MKSRFILTANKAAPGADRQLVFAPDMTAAEGDRQFVGANKANTVSILVSEFALAAQLQTGGRYFLEITPAS